MPELPQRRRLHHDVPPWARSGSLFFVTICAGQRRINTLARSGVAQRLIESAAHYHVTGVWWMRLILVMPDHLHALFAVPPDRELARVITAWKSYQAKALGIAWQTGFFDHRLRNDESLESKVEYIRQNPVRAGLVNIPAEWPYSWDSDTPG